MSQTMLLLRCILLVRLLQGSLMWMSWLLSQLVLIWLTLYPLAPLMPMFPLLCSLPSPFLDCYNMSLVNYNDVLGRNVDDCVESLGTFRGYSPSLHPYSLYLRNVPIKIMLTIVCNNSKDFSKEFDKFRRALTIILRFLFKCSYLHPSELHAQVFDKLLWALTASEWVPWVMRWGEVADAPSNSHRTILRRW